MTSTSKSTSAPATVAKKSTTEKAVDATKSTAKSVAAKVADTTHASAEAAKHSVADEVSGVASALRNAARDMRNGSPQERTIGQIAESLADAGDAIRGKEMGDVVRDVGDIARRNPVLFLGGAALLGFAATRFVKAGQPETQNPLPQDFGGQHRGGQHRGGQNSGAHNTGAGDHSWPEAQADGSVIGQVNSGGAS